jgi:hypothetical protein
MSIGNITLPATPHGKSGEACLWLISNGRPSHPVFKDFANLQVRKQISVDSAFIKATENALDASPRQQMITVAKPAPGLDLAGQYKWLTQGLTSSSHGNPQHVWDEIRLMTGWVDGQNSLDSIYSPLEVELDSDNGLSEAF